jgi:hypothetical protein
MVESQPSKLLVASSILVSRSIFSITYGQPRKAATKSCLRPARARSVILRPIYGLSHYVCNLNRIEAIARTEAARCGLSAMDALHVAAAYLMKADEFITTEKPVKPMYRTTLVKVRWLYG